MEIVKHYRNNEKLRRSFNALAEKTFGLNFENWYQWGFWGNNYDPYSVVLEGEVVANVSVNRTDLMIDGERRKILQLGTVMTAEHCRNRGYIRAIMEEIDRDYPDVDGVYLFANDSVVEFYPKFGFRKGTEYVYSKTVDPVGACAVKQVPMDGPEGWNALARAMEENTFRGACDMVDNPGLIFFYVAQFMRDCVYYSEKLDAWVIAEAEEDSLMIHNVFAKEQVSLDAVIGEFGPVKKVTLGFAPAEAGFEKEELHEEDCTFFVRGKVFEDFEAKCLRIPSLAHA